MHSRSGSSDVYERRSWVITPGTAPRPRALVPDVSSSSPSTARRSVVLPDPFRPVTATRSPGCTSMCSGPTVVVPRATSARSSRAAGAETRPDDRSSSRSSQGSNGFSGSGLRSSSRSACRTFVIRACVPRRSAAAPPARASVRRLERSVVSSRRRSWARASVSYAAARAASRRSAYSDQPPDHSTIRRERGSISATRSTEASRNARSCETRTTAPGYEATKASRRSSPSASRSFVGSSRSRRSARASRAAASEARPASPPDSPSSGRPRSTPSRRALHSFAARGSRSPPPSARNRLRARS